VGISEFSSARSEIGSEGSEQAEDIYHDQTGDIDQVNLGYDYSVSGPGVSPLEDNPAIWGNAPDAESLEDARDVVNLVDDRDEVDAELGVGDSAEIRSEGSDDVGSEGSDDVGSDGYDRQAAAREDLRLLVNALDEVSRELTHLAEALRQESSERTNRSLDLDEQAALAEQIVPEVRLLTGTARKLVARGTDQEPDLAFSAAAQMTALKSDLRFAKKRYFQNRAWAKVWAALKRAAPRLWSLISHLVKVKEWSVTGEVGTGVLGLARASISVTFGK
jgi:hypothetical protein